MKMETLKLSLLAILILSGFSSCRKTSAVDTAEVDVFVKSTLINGLTAYGTAHFVTGTDPMISVAVHSPDGVTDSLFSYDSSNLYYHLEPSFLNGTYSATPPAPGTYTYNIKFNDGKEKSFTNVLAPNYLMPPTIVSLVKSTDANSIMLQWNPVAGAQAYEVIVTKGGMQIYASAYLNPSLYEFDLPVTNIAAYTPGTFTFELDAVTFESTTSNYLQAISSSTTTIDL